MNYAVKCGHPKIIRSIEQKSVLINPEFVENLHMAVKNEDVRKGRKHILEFLL